MKNSNPNFDKFCECVAKNLSKSLNVPIDILVEEFKWSDCKDRDESEKYPSTEKENKHPVKLAKKRLNNYRTIS